MSDRTGHEETITVAAADGYRLAVQLSGRPGAPALLLLPGQAGSHAWWNAVRPLLDRDFRTVTFDYRGTGASTGPEDRWTIETFARDAEAVIGRVCTSPGAGPGGGANGTGVCVFGTSMGGRVAQALALRCPESVARLVLACTGPGGRHEAPSPKAVRTALLNATGGERDALLSELFYSPAWTGTIAQSTLLGDPTMTRRARSAHLRVSRSHDAWDRLPELGTPTLILHGRDDLMCPVANAHALAERIPGSALQSYPTGRHGFFEEFAGRVVPAVGEFLLG